MEPFHSLDFDVDAVYAEEVSVTGFTAVLLGSSGLQAEEPVQLLGGLTLSSLPLVS
tara:strand:- start:1441 stop:1608 length:168 start_codon:yes stop_codon:yes gene_type:complete